MLMAKSPGGRRKGPARKPRATGLSRERILAETIQYLRRHPDQPFTMARAGAAVGATAMAVYGYFEDGNDLTDAIVAHVLDGLAAEIPREADWRLQARAWMSGIYRRLMELPQCVEMLSTSRGLPPAWMSATATLRRILVDAGLQGQALSEALFWISTTVAGFVRITLATPLEQQVAATVRTISRLEAGEAADLAPYADDVPAIFEQGLDIMLERTLASLEALRSSGETSFRAGS